MNQVQRSGFAVLQPGPKFPDDWVITVGEGHGKAGATFGHGFENIHRLLETHRDGLFANDLLLGAGGSNRDFGVVFIWRANVNHINFGRCN